jgi:hypothetical protein
MFSAVWAPAASAAAARLPAAAAANTLRQEKEFMAFSPMFYGHHQRTTPQSSLFIEDWLCGRCSECGGFAQSWQGQRSLYKSRPAVNGSAFSCRGPHASKALFVGNQRETWLLPCKVQGWAGGGCAVPKQRAGNGWVAARRWAGRTAVPGRGHHWVGDAEPPQTTLHAMALSHIIWNSQEMSSQGISNHLRTMLLLSASALISLLSVETALGQSEPAGFVFTDRMLFEILFDRPDAVPITNPRTLQDITGIKPSNPSI